MFEKLCVINEYTDLNLKYAFVNTFEKNTR